MTIILTRLAREGRLGPGDLVTHDRLGQCEVIYVQTAQSIVVKRLVDGQHYNFSGLSFGADARMVANTEV